MRKTKQITRCFIFDMDGTIFETSYDWARIKDELQTGGQPILFHLNQLEEPERTRKWNILEKYEDEATRKATLKRGMKDYLLFLKENGFRLALVTNNSKKNVDYLLKKFGLEFDCVITRESGLWKPEGAPFFKAMKNLGVTAGECVVVGDSLFDIQAAREADVRHIFIISCKPEFSEISGIYVCSSVKELTSKTQDLLK